MDGKELKRQQALRKVEKNYYLLEAYRQEKDSIDDIIDLALDYPSGANRWSAYEILKKQASFITGYNAANPELTTPDHYTVLTDFIDYLLPETAEESYIPHLTKYVDQYEVAAWYERAETILKRRKVQQQVATENSITRRLMLEFFPGLSNRENMH